MIEPRPYLSQVEVDEICEPLTNHAAQIRYLTREGLLVTRKPGGAPMVMRSELERVKGAGRFAGQQAQNPTSGPNVVGLEQWASSKRRHGTQTQRR